MDTDSLKKVIAALTDISDHFLRVECYSFYQWLMDLSKMFVELNLDKDVAHKLLTGAYNEWKGLVEYIELISDYGPPHISTFLEYYDKLAEAKEDK